ncbi:DNA polymerase II subunit B4 [Daucus carota subsp. sativus]|uniref:DNA polymerase II subunit B4 n=1 Tax=Daucus carota subsp. sativus TaxID=79200 RepID=UPI0007F03452|nr:PREDICTED: DNA polymerase epsilon subunit 3-like [Daucus carota subsp. sativus]
MANKTAPVADPEELPKTIVRRLVKDTLSQCSKDGDISVLKDSLLAFSVCVRIFIQYLSATANDVCKEANRNIITANDVFKALEEIEFPELIEPLKASLEEFKKKNSVKRSGPSIGKDRGKKSKVEDD